MSDFVIDKRRMRRAFSQAAGAYDEAAVMQREVCQRMLERLDYVKVQPDRILDVGCGTGWGTAQLAQRYEAAQVVALDIALGMLQCSGHQVAWWRKMLGQQRQFALCADVEALPIASNQIDLVWSNLALQWCNDLPATFAQLLRVLKVEGLLMFSTFGPDTLRELRAAFRGVDDHNHVNRFADMHDVGDMLVQAGFANPVVDMEYLTLTYQDVKDILLDLKAIGANNATEGRGQGLMGKQAWARLLANYEQFRQEGKLPATYEVIYGHAWKPAPRKTADGAVIVQTNFKLNKS